MTACLLYGIITSELPKMCPDKHTASIKDKFCPKCGALLLKVPLPESFVVVPWYVDNGVQYFIVGQAIYVATKKSPKFVAEVFRMICLNTTPMKIQKTLNELGYTDRAQTFLVEV
jgi:hypothetical protein